MTDRTTKKRVLVHNAETDYPFIILPNEQLESLTAVLRANNVYFWPDNGTITRGGRPPVIGVNFRRGTKGTEVQKMLDAVS